MWEPNFFLKLINPQFPLRVFEKYKYNRFSNSIVLFGVIFAITLMS